MILSITNRFVFIKTRKCGGTSVQNILKPFCSKLDVVSLGFDNQVNPTEPSPLEEFATMGEVKAYYNIDGFYTFGFIRNPFSIPLSRFLFEIKRGRLNTKATKKNFNNWCVNDYFTPMGRYSKDKWSNLLYQNGKCIVDDTFKLENLEESLLIISKKLNLPPLKPQHSNKSNIQNFDYRKWNSISTTNLVKEFFSKEVYYGKY